MWLLFGFPFSFMHLKMLLFVSLFFEALCLYCLGWRPGVSSTSYCWQRHFKDQGLSHERITGFMFVSNFSLFWVNYWSLFILFSRHIKLWFLKLLSLYCSLEFVLLMIFYGMDWLNILMSMKRTMHWFVNLLLPCSICHLKLSYSLSSTLMLTDSTVWMRKWYGWFWKEKGRYNPHRDWAFDTFRCLCRFNSFSSPQPIST